MSENPVLRKIRTEKGFATRLAKKCGITREAVWMWRKVPPRHAVRISRYMRLSIAKVCPELAEDPPARLTKLKAGRWPARRGPPPAIQN